MRTEHFLRSPDHPGAYTRAEVIRLAPWAAKVVAICGGYVAFEGVDDWQIWRRQK